jgi:hypothetical protein
MAMDWYYCNNATTVSGPVSEEELQALVRASVIGAETKVTAKGTVDWRMMSEVFPQFLTQQSDGCPPPLPAVSVPPPPQSSATTSTRSAKSLKVVGLGCGGLMLLLVGVVVIALLAGGAGRQVRAEDVIASRANALLDSSKQQIFDSVHPVGNATAARIDRVTIDRWANDNPTSKVEDVRQFTLDYTVSWEGPLTKQGYTKFRQVYDTESGRCLNTLLLETNGVTYEQVGYTIGYAGGYLLMEAILGE